MSRTVSARISKEQHDKLRERCNRAGCTINDWLCASIDYLLTGSSDFDFGDEEPKETQAVKRLSENQNLVSEFRPHHDSHGNYYTYDENTKKWTCHLNMDNARITP